MACALAPSLAQQAAPEISRERLRADLEFLTSAPLEGRASLTPGAARRRGSSPASSRRRGCGRRTVTPTSSRSTCSDCAWTVTERSMVAVRRSGEEGRFSPLAVAFPDPAARIALDARRRLRRLRHHRTGVRLRRLCRRGRAGQGGPGLRSRAARGRSRRAVPRHRVHAARERLEKTSTAQRHGAAALLVVTEPVNGHRTAPRAPGRANARPRRSCRASCAFRASRFLPRRQPRC